MAGKRAIAQKHTTQRLKDYNMSSFQEATFWIPPSERELEVAHIRAPKPSKKLGHLRIADVLARAQESGVLRLGLDTVSHSACCSRG